jgi:DNA-directed RNA polymerase specialized sigma24 family protein
VYQVARHAAGDGQDPEDLVQETYLRAYAGFGSYRGGNTRAWLAAIWRHRSRSRSSGHQPRRYQAEPAWLVG